MKTENLTCAEAPVSIGDSHPAAPLAKKKPRLLLADDSPQIRESLGKLLRNSGYHVTLAAHGRQVLELALNGDFDLLILDLNMPEMDGWDALNHISTTKPSLPVIIITAQPHQREWAVAEGARTLMEKPLDLPVLLKTIREHTAKDQPSSALIHHDFSARFRFAASEKRDFNFADSARRWSPN